jgi:hypothetical protein
MDRLADIKKKGNGAVVERSESMQMALKIPKIAVPFFLTNKAPIASSR